MADSNIFEDERTVPEGPALTDRSARPAFDSCGVEFVTVAEDHVRPASGWCNIEIWTANSIYRVNAALVCMEVVDRATGASSPDSHLIGRRLGGGQRRHPDGHVDITHPLPLPGTGAVFESSDRPRTLAVTSAVERIVVQIGYISVPAEEAEPLWDELTGVHHRLPGF
jgi:hypothetical protein